MGNLLSKVRRLERIRGTCEECGGLGAIILVDVRQSCKMKKTGGGHPIAYSESEAEALPGCSRCGAAQWIVLHEVQEPIPKRRSGWW